MPEDLSTSQVIIYTLEGLVLGGLVVREFFIRRKLKRTAPPQSDFAFENTALFELTYAAETEISATPECEIVPGTYIFFSESPKAQISYQQLNEGMAHGSNSRRYALRLIQRDTTEVQWITLERHLTLPLQGTANRVRCRISARSDEPTSIIVKLRAPDESQMERSIEMGVHQLSPGFEDFVMEAVADNQQFSLADNYLFYRLVISIEVKTGLSIDFRDWDIEVESV